MIRLAVRAPPEHADRVLAELLELAPGGVEEERGETYVEFAIYGPPGEVPDLGELQAAAGGGLVDVTTTSVPDDWADRWTDFHRPIEVRGRIGVRPSWWDAKEGLIDVVVDPGRAFGTGGHPTTEALIVTERFTRPSFGRLEIEVTIDDAKAYTKPWSATQRMRLLPDTELLEFECLENEKFQKHKPQL